MILLEDYVKKAKGVYGDVYDYSLVNFDNKPFKIKIICPIHGIFYQRKTKHLSGHGCPDCGMLNSRLKQTKLLENFINDARKVHGDKYDYSTVDYINSKTDVMILCPEHGEFQQMPTNHLRGKGCKYCGGTNLMNTEEFILKAKKIHLDKYDYSLVDYVNSQTKIKIICPKHGIFEQIPNNHLTGKGCKYCGGTNLMDTEEFILKAKKIHGDKYDYSLVDYVNSKTRVKIICPKHGIFEQIPNSHIVNKYGCKKCGNLKNINNERI